MEKDSDSSAATLGGSNKHNPSDHHLKHLNRISQKISKPPIATAKVPLRHQPPLAAPQQQQVYNIDKTEFKDVVQRLTGSASPALEQNLSPHNPSGSRLQRIRPPPLAYLTDSRPPPQNHTNTNTTDSFAEIVHSTAESPVSAYMRYLQSSTPNPNPNFAMPTWQTAPSSTIMMPNSPLGFGQILSPRSPQYPFFSPSSSFLPTSGQLGFPQLSQSPKLSVLNPR